MYDELVDNITSDLIDVISKNIDEFKKEYRENISVILSANGWIVLNDGNPDYENKITLKEIKNILSERGKTKVFEKDYRHFNAGNTNFNNHKEYLFVTEVNHA